MKKLLLYILIFHGFGALAQETEDEFTRQLWIDFKPKWNISEHEYIRAELGYRTVWPDTWDRYVLKGEYFYNSYNLLFKSDNTVERLIGGLGLFYLVDKTTFNTLELRPYAGYQLEVDFSEVLLLKQTLKVEQRTHLYLDENEPAEFGLRFRYKVETDLMIRRMFYETGRGLYVPLAIEVFVNVSKIQQFNEVLRVMPGIGYQFNSDFKVQFNLSYQYTQQEIGTPVRTNDIVFRFRVYKTIFGRPLKESRERND